MRLISSQSYMRKNPSVSPKMFPTWSAEDLLTQQGLGMMPPSTSTAWLEGGNGRWFVHRNWKFGPYRLSWVWSVAWVVYHSYLGLAHKDRCVQEVSITATSAKGWKNRVCLLTVIAVRHADGKGKVVPLFVGWCTLQFCECSLFGKPGIHDHGLRSAKKNRLLKQLVGHFYHVPILAWRRSFFGGPQVPMV